jgi:hypothetical protein
MSLTHSASLGIDTASLIIKSCENWMSGKSTLDAQREIRRRWAEADATEEERKIEGDLTAREAISRDWTRAEERLGLFMQVMESMEHIVECVSADSSRGKPKTHTFKPLFDLLLPLRTNRRW